MHTGLNMRRQIRAATAAHAKGVSRGGGAHPAARINSIQIIFTMQQHSK